MHRRRQTLPLFKRFPFCLSRAWLGRLIVFSCEKNGKVAITRAPYYSTMHHSKSHVYTPVECGEERTLLSRRDISSVKRPPNTKRLVGCNKNAENGRFFEFSLCLSRARLGTTTIVSIQWHRKRYAFSYLRKRCAAAAGRRFAL